MARLIPLTILIYWDFDLALDWLGCHPIWWVPH